MHMKLLSRASMSIRAVSSKVYKLRLYSQLCHPAAMAALLTTLSFLHKMKFPISENSENFLFQRMCAVVY